VCEGVCVFVCEGEMMSVPEKEAVGGRQQRRVKMPLRGNGEPLPV